MNTGTSCRRVRAFSLIEMMVAIVILGMGLLMAATMFPAGWTRARKLAEFTTQVTAGQTAATTVRLLTNVADSTGVGSNFLGDSDQIVFDASADPKNPDAPDGAVHVLHLENALADRAALPVTGELAWPEWYSHDTVDVTAPERFEFVEIDPTMSLWLAANETPPFSQISFQERVIPPLPTQPLETDVPPATPEQTAQWDAMLASRRFAWAVLYKLDDPLPSSPTETRSITMFFVTLRRTQASHRFARQDSRGIPPLKPDVTTKPIALDPVEDMLFPVPWLVNLKVQGRWDSNGDSPDVPGYGGPDDGPAKGVPSEAVANPDPPDSEARLIGQMLGVGSVLIDRLTGNVYTVKQHRFTGKEKVFDEQATVTLDREILVENVDETEGGNSSGQVDSGEDLRDFWVFPPPVLADPTTRVDGFVTFDGVQPVVSVETRQMYFSP